MLCIVYGIYNNKEDKWYIGSSSQPNNKRKIEHFSKLRNNKHENEKLQLACNTYGIDSFEHYILEEFESGITDNLKLARLEEFYISEFDSFRNGYNKTDNVVGSAMQTLEVRQKHWGELHGSSKYSNESIEKAFHLLADTTFTASEISVRTSIDVATVHYIKKGGHAWVHLKYPEYSEKISGRESIKLNTGTIYTNDSIIQAFKYLIDYPKDTFQEISNKSGIPIETISAISAGRQYKKLILDTCANALEYYSLGRLDYAKKYSSPEHLKEYETIIIHISEYGYLSRDKLLKVLNISLANIRSILELNEPVWKSVIIWSKIPKDILISTIKIISSRSRASQQIKDLATTLLEYMSNVR